jgi:hypothetical protein
MEKLMLTKKEARNVGSGIILLNALISSLMTHVSGVFIQQPKHPMQLRVVGGTEKYVTLSNLFGK